MKVHVLYPTHPVQQLNNFNGPNSKSSRHIPLETVFKIHVKNSHYLDMSSFATTIPNSPIGSGLSSQSLLPAMPAKDTTAQLSMNQGNNSQFQKGLINFYRNPNKKKPLKVHKNYGSPLPKFHAPWGWKLSTKAETSYGPLLKRRNCGITEWWNGRGKKEVNDSFGAYGVPIAALIIKTLEILGHKIGRNRAWITEKQVTILRNGEEDETIIPQSSNTLYVCTYVHTPNTTTTTTVVVVVVLRGWDANERLKQPINEMFPNFYTFVDAEFVDVKTTFGAEVTEEKETAATSSRLGPDQLPEGKQGRGFKMAVDGPRRCA
ncbi:hypothetical protein WN51_00786 [Melipona quadrifasciata]|uniref:Uncharacterized protein n=1 Tax=Melipona quadrifasciata TaxID=166423 RepID=A0A0M8ZYS9_9HYME|nr:hypothetical protein WN51_00786 [Melipona quadrifasciata]